jgi:pimeloyl-ACP methyl ester carboxylesterase
LLTPAEEQRDLAATNLRFDIDLLGKRLVTALTWTQQHSALRALPLGVFGASTGAAAALLAAATKPELVRAIVSRGGRPDLAGSALGRVRAPTLLLVGGADGAVLSLNESALAQLGCVRELYVIPGASHLFEEPGALEVVAQQAGDWFLRHLSAARRAAAGPL